MPDDGNGTATKPRRRRRKAAKKAEAVAPVQVDSTNRRSDDDVCQGHFATVIAGEHAGRYGVFSLATEHGGDGYPTKVILTTRDERNENLAVDYSDLRPAEPGGR